MLTKTGSKMETFYSARQGCRFRTETAETVYILSEGTSVSIHSKASDSENILDIPDDLDQMGRYSKNFKKLFEQFQNLIGARS